MKRYKLSLLLLCFTFTFLTCPDEEGTWTDWIFRLAYDFDISNGRLYTASTNQVKAFSLDDPAAPDLLGSEPMDRSLNRLFISDNLGIVNGNLNSGAFSINANGVPNTVHQDNGLFDGCSPIVANESHFFALINVITGCGGSVSNNGNVLRIVPKALPLPSEASVTDIQVADPQGLALAGDLLFVADGLSGLKIFSIADLQNIQLLAQRSDLVAQRVQVSEGLLSLVTNDRLMVFDYANVAQLQLLSEIPL